MNTFKVNDLVRFREENPSRIVFGVVVEIVDSCTVRVRWEDNIVSAVSTWNERLKHA